VTASYGTAQQRFYGTIRCLQYMLLTYRLLKEYEKDMHLHIHLETTYCLASNCTGRRVGKTAIDLMVVSAIRDIAINVTWDAVLHTFNVYPFEYRSLMSLIYEKIFIDNFGAPKVWPV
jgi:hypothetical protein